MLNDLFNSNSDDTSTIFSKNKSSINRPTPPSKRKEINLCGIINQGATCYLNTLIQTLFHTKEFRENLFSLSGEELGLIQSKNGQQTKQRVIPLELQRLFGQLLSLDQEACSTNRLTDSFGWTNNEELQQHDVQELNRILFSAIEQSLVGTKQSKLIQELYRGTCINKIRCLSCLNVFEREEEFLDISITVQGSPSLNVSLSNSFIIRENLNGNNQYKCEKCNNQYCDAEKYCQLKTLPPILTLSLLRFTYDFNTYQRIKETGNFEFPLELDLKEYMEDSIQSNLSSEYTQYELFSVIIHTGNAYGGHYHCYIKDYDNLGKWVFMDEIKTSKEKINNSKKEKSNEHDNKNIIENVSTIKEILLICNDDDDEYSARKDTDLVNLDYLKYDKPLELLKAFIYNRNKYEDFKIESVCADLTKVTGVSWNKRFRNKYGPIEKFLRKNDETFELSQDGKYVKLKLHDRINIISSKAFTSNELIEACLKECDEQNKETLEKEEELKLTDEDLAEIDAKYHWYDFDDSRITPIFSSKIKKQFEGKESAYMLFYRRKNISKKPEKQGLPGWLIDEITNENLKLKQKREEYENSLNMINVEFYLESDFYLEQNILNLKHQFENRQFYLPIDKRYTNVNNLQEILVNYCTQQQATDSNDITVYEKEMQQRKEKCLELIFDEKPSNWLLVKRVDTSSSGRFKYFVKSILQNDDQNLFKLISINQNFLIVLSKHDQQWPIGDDYEPIRIVFRYFDKKFEIKETSFTFIKSTQIKVIKEELTSFLINERTNYELGLTNEELNAFSIDSFTFNLLKSKPTSIIKQEVQADKILLDVTYDKKTIDDLGIKNGDVITVESEGNIDQLFDNNTYNLNLDSQNSNKVYTNRLHKINVVNCLISTEELKSGNLSTNELAVEESDLIKNIRIMALSSFNINTHFDNSHLRFLSDEQDSFLLNLFSNLTLENSSKNDFIYPVPSLHDDSVLGEIIEPVVNKKNSNETKLIFLLCPGKAPIKSNNEIKVKCYSDKSEKSIEVLVDLANMTVRDLTNQLIEKMNLEPIDSNDIECYYLKKLDWLGDVESVLNNFDQLCSDIALKHDQTLQITKGKLVAQNHLKLKVWIPFEFLLTDNKSESSENENVILNDFMDKKFKSFRLLDEFIVSNDTKLDDFKLMIQSSLINRNDIRPCKNIRLRILKKLIVDDFKPDTELKFQMKKPLIDWHKSLKQLHLYQESDIGIELLEDEEDNINQGIMLINCIKFDLKTRLCSKNSFKQVLWNINNGATLSSLKESIIKAYSDELEQSDMFRLHLAKRLYAKLQWILLKESSQAENSQTKKVSNSSKKKKGSNSSNQTNKSNLKQSPFFLDDGDLIAFTFPETSDFSTSKEITAQDFMSTEDLQFMNKKNSNAAELSRLRKERRLNNEMEPKINRRPEIGIKIKIDDFTEN